MRTQSQSVGPKFTIVASIHQEEYLEELGVLNLLEELKYLEAILDSKLSWNLHLNWIKKKLEVGW